MQDIIRESAVPWRYYVESRKKLTGGKIIRTNKTPEAEFSEWIVFILFNGIRAINHSCKFYDVECQDKKIQVKSVFKALGNNNGYKVSPKDKNNLEATHYAFVWFEHNFRKYIYLVEYSKIFSFTKSQISLADLSKMGEKIQFDPEVFSEELNSIPYSSL